MLLLNVVQLSLMFPANIISDLNNISTFTTAATIIIIIGDSLISWGEGSSLALVGNPSRDGVSIKILVWRHLKPNPQL